MWRAISIVRQPKTILGQCYVNTAHLTKASSKITTVITRGVVAVCIHHQGLVAVAFAPVFSEKQCSSALHIITWGAENWVY